LIETRPGAGGLIPGQAVANSPPDGYTLLGGPSSLFVILPAQKGNVPITVVPYNQGGTMAAVADIMGERVHGTIEAVFGLRGPLLSNDLKLIGQMAPKPEPEFPNVQFTPKQTKAFVEGEQKLWWPLVREFTPPEARN
jgi:tripartite-type tricarboxylate transporter receptor subunit TctC